jgi:hypothetical protein
MPTALAPLAEHGWIGVALLLIVRLAKPICMLFMRVVFVAYRVPRARQVEWVLVEAKRTRAIDLVKSVRASRSPRASRSQVVAVQHLPATWSASPLEVDTTMLEQEAA